MSWHAYIDVVVVGAFSVHGHIRVPNFPVDIAQRVQFNAFMSFSARSVQQPRRRPHTATAVFLCAQVTISGAAKVATTKEEFQQLKAAQAKSDIREKFVTSGLGDVDPEVRETPDT